VKELLCIVVVHAIVVREGGMFKCWLEQETVFKSSRFPGASCGVVGATRDVEHATLTFHELSLNFSVMPMFLHFYGLYCSSPSPCMACKRASTSPVPVKS
jgi:hypothetical protein